MTASTASSSELATSAAASRRLKEGGDTRGACYVVRHSLLPVSSSTASWTSSSSLSVTISEAFGLVVVFPGGGGGRLEGEHRDSGGGAGSSIGGSVNSDTLKLSLEFIFGFMPIVNSSPLESMGN